MVTIKKSEEIKILKQGGKILSSIVHQVAQEAQEGITTLELDGIAEKLFEKSGGSPSFKGFSGYPATTCISVNEELVHGIPRKDKVIKKGDIVSIDIGLKYKGLFTDMAVTVPIGKIPKKTQKLVKVTKKALDIGIEELKPGNTIGDIGYAVQKYVESLGYSVVRSLVGHGVGYKVHEDPRVPNFGEKGSGIRLEQGMVLALEPMVNIGQPDVMTKEDNWTIATADGSLCAHFEHTIAITSQGHEIITK
jgi:methionyl aminopeptidase